MKMEIILIILMLLFALRAVMARSLLKAVIGLALASATLTAIIFSLKSPLAAVFELSVCTGLITVIFISTIALTKPLNYKEIMDMTKGRIKRYWYLPAIIALIIVVMSLVKLPVNFILPQVPEGQSVNDVLWKLRHIDIIGQVVALIAGVFGITVLFKEVKKK